MCVLGCNLYQHLNFLDPIADDNIDSWVQELHVTSLLEATVPIQFCSQERKFHDNVVPKSETFAPGSESS